MRKVIQVFFMLKLPYSKSGGKLVNFDFLTFPTNMGGPCMGLSKI